MYINYTMNQTCLPLELTPFYRVRSSVKVSLRCKYSSSEISPRAYRSFNIFNASVVEFSFFEENSEREFNVFTIIYTIKTTIISDTSQPSQLDQCPPMPYQWYIKRFPLLNSCLNRFFQRIFYFFSYCFQTIIFNQAD